MEDAARGSITNRQPPRIKYKKGGAAFACLTQNLIHNIFFYLKFLALYGITTTLDDTADGLADGMAIPVITLFLLATTITFISSTLPAVAEVENDLHENLETHHTPEALETALLNPADNAIRRDWLWEIPKSIYFKVLPTINTFVCAFLAGNHVAEHFFGDSQDYKLYAIWPLEIFLFLLAGTKAFMNSKRKFNDAYNNYNALRDHCQHSKEKFRVKNWRKFMTKVVLPNICAMTSYLIATFFFYRMGCMEQLEEAFCELTAKKICDVRFDTTVTQPVISLWQISTGVIMTVVSFGTFAFTCIPASLKQYKKDISGKPIAPIDHKNAWKFVHAVNCIDAVSQSLIFFVGTAANLAFLSHNNMKDWQIIVPASLVAAPSAYSYLHFQNTYAEQKFNDTCRRFKKLGGQAKLSLKKLSCKSSHKSAVLEEVTTEKDSLINNSISINYDSTDNNLPPYRATRKICRIM